MEAVVAFILLIIGIVAMWYTLETIIDKKKKFSIKITCFMFGSVILYTSLSFCFIELLKSR
ncbi:hypothetical protein [Staphylococcus aureus]|uniref:hypothetical protein n=1 Tax=Staphylococcus aureus TaxID=1280 RepID=UPI001BFD4968|nr:hypothetical protein [Staphylococcus aureus]